MDLCLQQRDRAEGVSFHSPLPELAGLALRRPGRLAGQLGCDQIDFKVKFEGTFDQTLLHHRVGRNHCSPS